MKTIRHLPTMVHTSLRSSVYLFDLPRVVEELILNSLNARSSKVHVSVDVARAYVEIDDNGCGITREELELLGAIQEASELDSANYENVDAKSLLQRGETLGSLSDVSLVEVITKARGWPNGYRKVIKAWTCLFLGISDFRQDVGTTVIVRDLFYNQPVRQKYLHSSLKKVLHNVKKCVVRIALVHPQVSFKLSDIESEVLLLSTVPSPSPLPLITDAFGSDISEGLIEISASDKMYKLSGYLSRQSDASSAMVFQIFYINSRFVSKGPIQKLISDLASDHQHSLSLCRADPRFQNSKRRKTEGHVSYMLNLLCPASTYDTTFESSKSVAEFKDWAHVLSFIEKAIRHHWRNNSVVLDELKISNMQNQKWYSQSACHFHSLEEMFSSEPSSKDLNACLNDRSTKFSKKVAVFKACQSRTSCSYGSIQKDGCDVERNSKGSALSGMMTNYICSEQNVDIAPSLHIGSSVNDLATEAYELGHEHFGRLTADSLDDVSVCAYSSNTADISFGESVYFRPGTPCQDKTAELASSFVLKRCRRKRDCLFDNYFQLDLCSPDKEIENQSHTNVLREGFSSNLSSILHPLDFFELPISLGNNIQRNHMFSDEYLSSIDATDSFSCREESFGCHAHDAEFYLNMTIPFSRYCYDNSFGAEKGIMFKDPCVEFDSIGLSSIANPEQFKSSDVDNRGNCKYTRGSFLARDLCHQNHVQRRSHSAPPFSRRKSKFSLPFDSSHKSHGKSTGLFLHDLSIAKESHVPCNEIKKTHSSSKMPTKKSLKNCRKFYQKDYDDEMLPVYKKGRKLLNEKADDQLFPLSFAKSANFRNPTAVNVENEIDPQSGTAKWRNGKFQLPMNMHVGREHKFSCGFDDILNTTSGFLSLAASFLQPESISRDSLKDARVLPQLDKKFIPIVADGVLAVIDQHAADERIRLEELRQKVLSDGGTGVTYLETEQELVLPEIGCQLLQNYSEQIKKWGWTCNFHRQRSESFSKNLNLLKKKQSGVTLNTVPCILGINLTDKDLIEFLEQLAETDGSALVPPAVNRILNTKACRGAIMFGDSLLPSECSLIVEELKQTSLCFQCAHGRPTAAPIVNIVELHKQLSNLQPHTGEHADGWHGLKRHKPSLERTQQWLSAAMSFRRR